MNRELILQELSDDELEVVTGGDTVFYITFINISNSTLINSPVGSFNGNVLVNSSFTYNGGSNINVYNGYGTGRSSEYQSSWGGCIFDDNHFRHH